MTLIRRLASGLPATTTGPLCPPCTNPSADVRSSPAVFSLELWQAWQLFARTGRIFFSKNSVVSCTCAQVGAAEINRMTLRQNRIAKSQSTVTVDDRATSFTRQLLKNAGECFDLW